MEIKIIKNYSYKVCQKIEMELPNKSLEYAKFYVDAFIKSDKEDPFLTFVEYCIFLKDKDGFTTCFYKDLNLSKNLKKALENVEVIYKWLKLLEKEQKNKNKHIKISVYKNS